MNIIKYQISKRLADTIFTVCLMVVAAVIVQYIGTKQSQDMQNLRQRLEALEQTEINLKNICDE